MDLSKCEVAEILIVDDNPAITRLLATVLAGDGHRVTIALDGREAFARVAERVPDLVLLDLDMPGPDGFEVCRSLKADPATRLLPIIIITGRGDADVKLRAWELGADEFLAKPLQIVEVRARCRSLLRVKRLVDALDSAEAVVFAMARAVEAKSPYTHGHAERVTRYALMLAERVGITEAERMIMRRGGLLHDIGKISTPDVILDKPGRLTPEEYDVVKQHPLQGVRILEPLRSTQDVLPLVRWHHERMDGKGYPDGIFGGSIPLAVRVLSVADVYDALTSARAYRPAMPHEQAVAVLRSDAESGGLDPDLVETFLGASILCPAAAEVD